MELCRSDRRSPLRRGLPRAPSRPSQDDPDDSLRRLVLAPLTAVAGMAVPGNGYYLSGTLIVVAAIVPFFVSFEGRRPTAREIAVVAVLTALAVAARAALIWVPHFAHGRRHYDRRGSPPAPKPGSWWVRALASNFIFGQGPWTPWQMLAFGVAGLVAGLLADARVFPASEPFLAASYCAGNRGVQCLLWARGSHSGYVHVLLSFHSPHAGAGRGGVPRRPAGERHSWGGHGSHAAGRGEPPARPTRPRPREVRFIDRSRPNCP